MNTPEEQDAMSVDENHEPVIGEGAADTPDAAEPAPAEEPAVDPVVAERDHYKDQLLRTRAEFDNYRKRMAREVVQIRTLAAEALLRELLPVLDNLELALYHTEDKESKLAEGVALVAKQLADVLQSSRVEPIAAVGERFDPQVHEAIAAQPSEEHEADIIIQEFQRGYRLGERVLRPSRVAVSSGPATGGAAPDSTE